jgi:aspartyl-tRNA(Asn)/glutamyl-tRNA(Gln) amidotransferase subunit B
MTTTDLQYETVIGVEVHAQLLTRSKMFCSCSHPTLDSHPNTHVCPVCLGLPGTLPVINRQALELTIMTGLALNCHIPEQAKFDRKNYHYPDLMKGYQISEYDQPLCQGGWLEIEAEGASKRVGITRVHLEEDTARLQHATNPAGQSYSLVDVNRSGVPLMEIVSEPELRSAEDARAYLVKLRQILRYISASRANMEEGNMRCEPNVSVRPLGQAEFGVKVELKNINSFRHAYDAIRYEEQRQVQLLQSGGRVIHETRGWRADGSRTVSQRSKEHADDYRYFPEPDLPPIAVGREWVEEIRTRMPELPDAKRARFQQQYGLSAYDTAILIESRPRAEFFEDTVSLAPGDEGGQRAKLVANWMNGEVARLLNANNMEIEDSRITPQSLSEIIALQGSGTVSGKTAKDVFEEMFGTGRAAAEIVREAGLTQITAADEIGDAVDRVLDDFPKAVEDHRRGKEEAIKFLVGQVMRETKGRARPDIVHQLLREKLRVGP